MKVLGHTSYSLNSGVFGPITTGVRSQGPSHADCMQCYCKVEVFRKYSLIS